MKKYGTYQIGDALKILFTLREKQFQLCFADIPWGSDYDKREKRDDKIHYNDEFKPEIAIKWLEACQRVAETVIFIVGTKHLFWWIQNTNPIDIFYFGYPYTKTPSTISKVSQVSPTLVWGNRKQWLNTNLVKDKVINYPDHPAAKSTYGILQVLKQIKPISVVDPFCGTGYTIEACEILQIPCMCIDIEPKYTPLIEQRQQNGLNRRLKGVYKNFDSFLR